MKAKETQKALMSLIESRNRNSPLRDHAIAVILNLNERAVRAAVRELIPADKPVCSSPNGYYIGKTAQDFLASAEFRGRAVEKIMETVRKQKAKAKLLAQGEPAI